MEHAFGNTSDSEMASWRESQSEEKAQPRLHQDRSLRAPSKKKEIKHNGRTSGGFNDDPICPAVQV